MSKSKIVTLAGIFIVMLLVSTSLPYGPFNWHQVEDAFGAYGSDGRAGMGVVVEDAVIYWAPAEGKSTEPPVVIPAGKTVIVFNEANGFYRIQWAESHVWVLKDTISLE